MHRPSHLGVLALFALLASSIVPGAPHSAARASALGVLPGHFGFGLAAQPDSSGIYGWMPNSGIPWDYAYQYLNGGVNTGTGWETWNSQGQFALWYAQGAAAHHYIPVFPYYEMLQSSGSCTGCGEVLRDFTNLNAAGTMRSYFANFRLLMQRLSSRTYSGIAGFGQAAIVQIEPDLSGYAQQAVLNNSSCYGFCTGTGNSPALLRAAVASSGDADVVAYPNTYQGFNWALLHLRDLYAPNVLLAFHLSNWATRTDIGSSTAAVDATALGQEAGSFAAQSGMSGLPAGVKGYDLVFNDVSDRDAAYYKYVYGNPTTFWDRANVTVPNFLRWEAYVRAVNGVTGRPILVWQVPEGNQYFDTENNTNGHYQDNRAEYFFGHVGELASAGVIGVLFGSGNAGSTSQSDALHDGVTNPTSFCTHDGLSTGLICNNHSSSVADDDGGYIRAQGQQYYASGGYLLGGPTATPSATPFATITATATATPRPPTVTMTRAPSVTATRTPSATATAKMPLPTATATPGSAPLVQAAIVLEPLSPQRGAVTTMRTTISLTSGALQNGVVDVEVYNSATWVKVGQQFYSGQNLVAGQSASYAYAWSAPNAAGQYAVMVGVFGPNWSPSYYWNSAAAQFTIK